VQTPVVHVAHVLYWQQSPPVQMLEVHQSLLLHGSPLALSGKHWPALRYSLAWHEVHTPVVQVVHPVYWQQKPPVQRLLMHQSSVLHVPLLALSG
jgi:hypothetical protein